MAKIALALEQALARRAAHGAPGQATGCILAQGDGWQVSDVICTSGPQDRSFEEQHGQVSIAIVVAGTFQYCAQCRSGSRRELMTPGSLLLGNPGQCFECGHEHGEGDRCISFQYEPDYFETLAADAGARRTPDFSVPRLPPLRASSPLIARACAGLLADPSSPWLSWEELSVQLAAQTMQIANSLSPDSEDVQPGAMARVTRTVRTIERHPEVAMGLRSLARVAGLSPYHFLRTFERVTGLTPHQYILRARLRGAAMKLTSEPAKIVDIAFDSGFGDVSNFNRAFRTEFGMSPRSFRGQAAIQ